MFLRLKKINKYFLTRKNKHTNEYIIINQNKK